ncbi:glycoside hydrolase family 43 protein [Pontibacter lucknowensis]|uniref:Alpha-N-arabinofuranosidase n=1 Tax=Pontibacter lucknowensis TaxID=1077936 RepID=A0A1N7A6F1_9BACT|nr:glycoside hydrolase family 43 protein [Pontibacter lucknowensis]SIR34662.1 alpha-N-arabinofuranosidase [Pontibacter lucknowensis]
MAGITKYSSILKKAGLAMALFLISLAVQAQEKFLNPILAGFYPDPSICRAGDDFYLVHSTFSYYPGVPIFHSKDLVNWKQIGNILDRPEQLDVEGLGVSRGIFAPAIEYHDGVFYMITTLVDKGGNFVVTATNPAGPWSDPVWLREVSGIDPSIFFDKDGKAYILYNSDAPDNKPLYDGHRTIRILEFDYKNLKTVGQPSILVNGGVDISKKPVWIEGPHIYNVNGYYYLMAAEGGTSVNHSEVILRSEKATGPYVPYDKNPILTQRHLPNDRPNPVSATGHADLVQTKNGEWWAVFLATRPYDTEDHYNIGRETFLAPVTWQDGWPIINAEHELVQYSYTRPNLPEAKLSDFPLNGNFRYREDFNDSKLPMHWLMLRTPHTDWYSLSQPSGKLTLAVRPEELSGKSNPSFLTRRQQHIAGSASTIMEFQPTGDSEFAGIAAFQGEKHHYLLGKTIAKGKQVVQLRKADGTVLAEQQLSKKESKLPLQLKIDFDGARYAFSYATKDGAWKLLQGEVDGRYLSTRVSGGFVGVTLGIFATSQGKSSNSKAAFDWFDYEGNDAIYNSTSTSLKQ